MLSYEVDEVIKALVKHTREENGKTVYPAMRDLLNYLSHFNLFVALGIDGEDLNVSVVDKTNEQILKDLEQNNMKPEHHIGD